MKKKYRLLLILALLLPSICCVAQAESSSLETGFTETDQELFLMCCNIAGYTPPKDYTLVSFTRLDINGDDIIDVVASMRKTEGDERLLIMIISGPDGYTVKEYLSEQQLSESDPVKWEALQAAVSKESENASQQNGKVYCNACGKWYGEGEEFRNHVCVTELTQEMIRCDVCGGMFAAGASFDNHACKRTSDHQKQQCPVCNGWFDEGSEFRNHICVTYPNSTKVFCDVCSGWFDEGEAFRNHICVQSP